MVNPDSTPLVYPEEQFGEDLRGGAAFLLQNYEQVEAFGLTYNLIDFDIALLAWDDFISEQSLSNILNTWVSESGLPPKNFIFLE